MTREEFRELTKKVTLYDGGTGTYLMAHGMPNNACTEVWVNENPQVLTELQRGYVQAGSQIILAPTFGANRERLRSHRIEDQIVRLNTENVALSKAAADGKALVAGDMSMSGLIIYPDDDESFDEAVEVYREQAELLVKAGVDLFTVETMISLEDARAALKAIRDVSDLPVMVTLSFETNQRTLYGDTPENAAKVLTDEGADAVGTNCSTGPENMKPIIEIMAGATSLPIIAKPNAGMPKPGPDGRDIYDLGPEDYVKGMLPLIDAGAKIVGGCCGTTPEYIRALAQALK